MNSPLVSVIIPTYNRAALLCEAVDSVLQQTYRNIEVIVVDDGSTDDTTAAMEKYGDRVRYSRRPNAGVNAARNLGFKQARGEYIALLDSDDLWAPYKLELQVRLLRFFTDVGFTFSNFLIFKGSHPDADSNLVMDGLQTWFEHVPERIDPYQWHRPFASLKGPSLQLPREDFTISGGDIYASSLVCPYVLPSTSLIRKSALAQLRLPEIQATCGDWEFFARLSKQSQCLYIDLPTTFNRSHEDAVRLTRGDPGVRLGQRISMIDRVWRADRQFYSKHGERVDEIQRRLLLKAAKQHLVAGRGGQARAQLKRASSLPTERRSAGEAMLRVLAGIPGSSLMLQATRATLHGVRQLMAAARQ
jgi:glycosyltransferase involved in cell wall biosynthesis